LREPEATVPEALVTDAVRVIVAPTATVLPDTLSVVAVAAGAGAGFVPLSTFELLQPSNALDAINAPHTTSPPAAISPTPPIQPARR
jgi:hypothetical protein